MRIDWVIRRLHPLSAANKEVGHYWRKVQIHTASLMVQFRAVQLQQKAGAGFAEHGSGGFAHTVLTTPEEASVRRLSVMESFGLAESGSSRRSLSVAI
jgi:hypothetical protein